MKALLINAHRFLEGRSEGRLTRSALDVARDFFIGRGDEVLETTIADGYVPEEEAAKFLEADTVIVQAPIHWFSAPWIWKKYVDEVFDAGSAAKTFLNGDGRTRTDASRPYGSGGLMAPRTVLVSTSWNAPSAAFGNPDNTVFLGRSLADATAEISAPFRFCGFTTLPDFAFLDIYKNPRIAEQLEEFRAHLAARYPA